MRVRRVAGAFVFATLRAMRNDMNVVAGGRGIRMRCAFGSMPGLGALLLGACTWCGAAAADDGSFTGGRLTFQPSGGGEGDAKPAARVVPEYASAESKWWTIGTGVAYDFDGSTDVPLRGAFSYFLGDGIELSAEVAGWYFAQKGDDAAGLSGSVIFRWHFVRRDPWTVYLDTGIGLMGATDDVPADGTSFNFMPQAGAGVTRRLNDDGLRLQAGLRWHHISNARITGDDDNPDRDAPMLYVGLIFPF